MTRALALVASILILTLPVPAVADGDLACLKPQEQRDALASGQAIPLATAIHSVRGTVRARGAREVVKARLCREGNHLVYVLTVLSRDGKVTRATVDAGKRKAGRRALTREKCPCVSS